MPNNVDELFGIPSQVWEGKGKLKAGEIGHCANLSPLNSETQYIFATLKPSKSSSVPCCCKIDHFDNAHGQQQPRSRLKSDRVRSHVYPCSASN